MLQNRNSNYETLELVLNQLAPEERQDFMANYWRFSGSGKNGDYWRNFEVAIRLARKGFVPAFGYLVENNRNDPNRLNQVLALNSVSCIDSLEKWYRENKNQIVFNSEKELYEAKK